MPIPSQDKLVEYLDSSTRQPITKEPEEIVEPIESPYKTNLLTSTNARKKTRRNITELEKLTGENFGIVV